MDEYIVINISQGSVNHIEQSSPHTESARSGPENQNRFQMLGAVLTKMAEYDYELVPGIVIPQNDLTFNIVMRRKKT